MSPSPDSISHTPAPAATGTLALLGTCFVLSGAAALVYQTAWTRQFAIVFGTSELAVATVLAAYMGGLALGAYLAERFLPRITRPVLAYAVLEIGIAAGAVVVVPALLALSNLALQALFGSQPVPPSGDHAGTTLFYLASAFLALALPTTLMGATLPMLARHAVAEEAQIGRRIGLLYALNTAGAVAGALLTAFVLLPELGLKFTVGCGAALNALVFLFAATLARREPSRVPPAGYSLAKTRRVPLARPQRHSFREFPGPAWVLPLMLLAGAVAFFHEVLWTRMLAHLVGSSIHAFGVMVASFLAGIALGGALGAWLARTRERAALALAIALLVAAAAAGLAYLNLESLLPARAGLFAEPGNATFAGLLLLPMTLAIGTTFPLAVRVLARDADDAAYASARVYSWNTVGAIVGSLAAGFVLIPALKYEGAIRASVWASAVLGVAAAWILVRLNRGVGMAATAVAAAGCALFAPQPPLKLLVTSPLNVGTQGRVQYYGVGRSASVVMLAQDGGFALRTNGLPEALMDGPGSLPRFSGEYWLSPLAAIARPAARDLLVVGFGGGSVIEGAPPSLRHIDVIELEPRVIDANRRIAPGRRRDPLSDPRVNVILNDARGALRLTDRRYDAIVSQPSHPWTAGASHLYTREFMRLAREHLAPGGVFVQWMNVIFLDDDLLRSLTATLLDVFPEVRIYRPDPQTLIFVASSQPLDLEARLLATGEPLRDAPLHYARVGINNAEDLVTALVADTDGAQRLARGAPLITDDDNRIATSSVYERGHGLTTEAAGRVLAAYDPLQNGASFVYTNLRDRLSFAYVARRTAVFTAIDASLFDRMARMAQLLGQTPDGEYARSFYYRLRRQGQRSSELLRLAVDQYPADETLRLALLQDWFGALARDAADAEATQLAAGLHAPATEVLAAARHAAKNEWRDVALADEALAAVPWTHEWYAEALDLRATWRTRITSSPQKKRFADEAVSLVDRAALMNPTLALYGMRTRAGFAGERPDVVVESVSSYVKLATGMVNAGVPEAATLRADAKALRQILDDAGKLAGADAARIAEVRAEVEPLAGPAR